MKQNYLSIFQKLPFPAALLSIKAESLAVDSVNNSFRSNFSEENCSGALSSVFLQEIFGNDPVGKEFVNTLQEAASSGEASKTAIFETSFFAGGKNPEYWEAEVIPVTEKNSENQQLVLFYNKTSEVRATQQLQKFQKEAQLDRQGQKHFIGNNPDGLYSLDREGKFLHVNEGLVKLAELSEEELINTSFLPFCAPESQQRVLEYFHKTLQGEKQEFEDNFISAKGTKLVLQISLVPMKFGKEVIGVFGIAKDITSLRNTQEELERKEKKFRALVQKGSELMVILNPEGTYKFVSENVRNIMGHPPSHYLGKSAFDFMHPEDKDRVLQEFSALDEKKQIKGSAYRFKDAAGKWRWLESTAVDLRDDPAVEGVVANSREVTEIVEQNRQIEQLHQRFKLAATATNDLVYDWDLHSDEVLRFSTPGGRHFGYSTDELNRRLFWAENIHPEEIRDVRKYLHQSLEDPFREEMKTRYRFRRKDGSYAEVIDRATIIRDENQKPLRLIGATTDISDILENQNALKMANTRFSFAMRATKEMIWDWDIENRMVKRSESFRKMFGYDARKMSGNSIWFRKIHTADRERVKTSLDEALQNKEIKKWRQEYRMLKKDNSVAFVIDRGFILRNEKGIPVRMVGALLDVTESREMISEIKKQNEVLKKVAWEQAHVVRQPLARLKGLVNILTGEEQEEWSREELLNLINESVEELDQVISSIIRKTEEVGENAR